MQGNGLPVIAGSGAARRHRQIVRAAVAQHGLYLTDVQGLHYEVSDLAIQLLPQDRRIPVKVAGELFDRLGMGEHAHGIIQKMAECDRVARVHRMAPRCR